MQIRSHCNCSRMISIFYIRTAGMRKMSSKVVYLFLVNPINNKLASPARSINLVEERRTYVGKWDPAGADKPGAALDHAWTCIPWCTSTQRLMLTPSHLVRSMWNNTTKKSLISHWKNPDKSSLVFCNLSKLVIIQSTLVDLGQQQIWPGQQALIS